MPGSLLFSPPSPRSRVSRHDSTRSDHSDGSNTSHSSNAGKKVSFNKAVRVKKYTRSKKSGNSDISNGGLVSNGSSPEKRFWFKVYKNKHRQSPNPKELYGNNNDVIYYHNNVKSGDVIKQENDVGNYVPSPSPLNYPSLSEGSTQTPPPRHRHDSGLELHPLNCKYDHQSLHQSQLPVDVPDLERNRVKKIVSKFNEEAILARQRSIEDDVTLHHAPLGCHKCNPHIKECHICLPTPTCHVCNPSPLCHECNPDRSPLECGACNFSSVVMQRIPTPPPEPPPIYYPSKTTSSKSKKNPIVNGVKVMFGMAQPKKKEKTRYSPDYTLHTSRYPRSDHTDYVDYTSGESPKTRRQFKPYKTEITIPDLNKTEVKSARDHRLAYAKDIRLDNGNELVPKSKGGLFSHDEDGNTNDYYNDDFFANGENDENNRRSKYHVETFDTGNELVYDTTDVNTSSKRVDNGEMFCTVGENHQLWRNNRRMIIVEEPSPKIIRRKAKSQSDLSQERHSPNVGKVLSTESISNHRYDQHSDVEKDSKDWMDNWSETKDKGVQCNQVPTSDRSKPEEIYAFGKYKVLKPRNGGVTCAYSNGYSKHKDMFSDSIHKDELNTTSSYQSGDLYSIIDKTKKKRDQEKKKYVTSDSSKSGNLFKSRSEPLYIGPAPKNLQSSNEKLYNDSYEDYGDHKVKTSRKTFGFHLSPGREDIGRKNKTDHYREENWYDIDDDLDIAERRKIRGRSHRDISEVRQELDDDEFASDISSNGEIKRNGRPNSIVRGVDYKKREISYENVHRPDGENQENTSPSANGGLWFRDAEEDYRKEMAENTVSYPAGSHVGSDRFYTTSRSDKYGKQKPPSSPRAFTLDRRHFKEHSKNTTPNTSGVKILVNGKEVGDKTSTFKKNKNGHHPHRKYRVNEDPSSVQSDPLYVRGGLAAAYQARQRAAVRRSNSSIAGINVPYRSRPISPIIQRKYQAHSDMSGSETESTRAHRPLVMYIPGISHRGKSPSGDDRSSGVNVARSQSMLSSSRSGKIIPKSTKPHLQTYKSSSKPDLYHLEEYCERDDQITPLASEYSKKKPPKVPHDSKKNGHIKRSHSMPKDTKFSWLKWKIRGKPSREP